VNDNQLQKRPQGSMKEKGQYLLAFGVVGSMLLVAGFPVFVIFFFAIFAYFIFRIFASGGKNETREIFEFYLTANEILRDDGRNWFGFEVKDAIARGESIVSRMMGAPPLVHFALGALYNKVGDHQAAINSLTPIIEGESGNEGSYVFPTQELRNYVKVLRKIERDPSEAPLTSASIRALERARRLRGKAILEESRAAYVEGAAKNAPPPQELPERTDGASPLAVAMDAGSNGSHHSHAADEHSNSQPERPARDDRGRKESSRSENKDPFSNRKPITEVLHDIYDKNVQ
jgi:hypothetical protein